MTNIMIMKTFEILKKVLKCDPETQNEQMLLEKMTQVDLAGHRVATNLQFVKYIISRKCNTAKCNKMRYASVLLFSEIIW